MNSIEDFDDCTAIPKPSLAINQSFQHNRYPCNYQNNHLNNISNNLSYHNGYHDSPRQVIPPQNIVGSPLIRRPCFVSRPLFNSTSNCYRLSTPSEIPVQYYQPRSSVEYRHPLYPPIISNNPYTLRQPCRQPILPTPSYQLPNHNQVPIYNNSIRNVQRCQMTPIRILQKPIFSSRVLIPGSEKESLSSLNPATVTISIPLSNLRDCPANMMDIVDEVSKMTKTHIFAYDGGQIQGNRSLPSLVKYCIYGKWRDCFEAGKNLWKKLTKIYTAYIHESWLSFIDQKITRSGVTLRKLYSVDIKHIPSMKVLAISGYYWDVLKMRKELVLRQKKKVTKMTGDMLVVDYASDSGLEESESVEILSQIRNDIDSSLLVRGQSLQQQQLANNYGHSFEKFTGGPSLFNSLKATEIIKLLSGPDIVTNTESIFQENASESDDDYGQSQETDLVFSGNEVDEEIDEHATPPITCGGKVERPSIIFVPGEDVPIFSSELYGEDDFYPDVAKHSTVGNKASNEKKLPDICDNSDDFPKRNSSHPFQLLEVQNTITNNNYGDHSPGKNSPLSGDGIDEVDKLFMNETDKIFIDDTDKLEKIEFPSIEQYQV